MIRKALCLNKCRTQTQTFFSLFLLFVDTQCHAVVNSPEQSCIFSQVFPEICYLHGMWEVTALN